MQTVQLWQAPMRAVQPPSASLQTGHWKAHRAERAEQGSRTGSREDRQGKRHRNFTCIYSQSTSTSAQPAGSRAPERMLACRRGLPQDPPYDAITHLQLDVRLCLVLLAATTARNLLRLRDLVPHVLRAEVLERVPLDRVDAEYRAGLHGREAAGHCILIVSNPTAIVSSLACSIGAPRTEELLVSARLLNDLHKSRLQLLDGRYVGCQDTHLSRLGGDVDLYAAISISVLRLRLLLHPRSARRIGKARTHLATYRWTITHPHLSAYSAPCISSARSLSPSPYRRT